MKETGSQKPKLKQFTRVETKGAASTHAGPDKPIFIGSVAGGHYSCRGRRQLV